jgi:voltage-gated sodium channel
VGLSLLNSIFVDAMVSDNNDELEKRVKELSDEI